MSINLKLLWFLLLGLIGMMILQILQVNIMNEPREITNKQLLVEKVYSFTLSPDGEQIIFSNHQGFKILSLKTGNQRLILPLNHIRHIRTLNWSSDKKWFAFLQLRLKPRCQELCLFNLQNNQIYYISKAQNFVGFAFSPDGRRLAWIEEKRRGGKVRRSLVVGMLGTGKVSNFKVLYSEEREEISPCLEGVQWSPDGRFLVFRSANGLGVIKPDGTGLRWISPKPPLSRKGFPMHEAFTIYSWTISPDSETIAFGFGGDIWLCQIKEIKEPIKIASKYTAIELCWSPDGKGLLLVSSSPKALPPAPGCLQRNPPHQLHWVSRDGQKHCLLLEEEKGIYDLQWVKGKDIFYLSGSSLWKVTLKF